MNAAKNKLLVALQLPDSKGSASSAASSVCNSMRREPREERSPTRIDEKNPDYLKHLKDKFLQHGPSPARKGGIPVSHHKKTLHKSATGRSGLLSRSPQRAPVYGEPDPVSQSLYKNIGSLREKINAIHLVKPTVIEGSAGTAETAPSIACIPSEKVDLGCRRKSHKLVISPSTSAAKPANTSNE